MHLQVRCHPKASPPDVEKVLGLLATAGVNLIGVGGSDLEFGGELALVPEHGQEQQALEALADYHPRLLDSDDPESGLTLCEAQHQSGGLRACLQAVGTSNLSQGRIIRDILIGVPDDSQHGARIVPVQIYSELVRTPQNIG
jgi:hypothetical protein